MPHYCGYCSACLQRITTWPGAGVEDRARLGVDVCCHCQQRSLLYGALTTDTTVAGQVYTHNKPAGLGVRELRRS